jgi:hypothetical protein
MYQRRSSIIHRAADLKWHNLITDGDEDQRRISRKKKMPIRNNNIIIQQDGVSAHLPEGDPFVLSKGGRELFGNQAIKKMLSNPTLNQLNHQIKMSMILVLLPSLPPQSIYYRDRGSIERTQTRRNRQFYGDSGSSLICLFGS